MHSMLFAGSGTWMRKSTTNERHEKEPTKAVSKKLTKHSVL